MNRSEQHLPSLRLRIFLCASALLWITTASAIWAGEDSIASSMASPQNRFVAAGQAYDSGQFDVAATIYEDIYREGYVAEALFFNLGNTRFKQGHGGLAVLSYLRALRLNPRNSDAISSMNYVIQSLGATVTSRPFYEKTVRCLSTAEWVTLLTAAYWMAGLMLAGRMFSNRLKTLSAPVLWACGLVIFLSAAALTLGHRLDQQGEMVILADKTQALYAPLKGSTAHFEVTEGSTVRFVKESEGWIKIRSGEREGWIPRDKCARVYPWPHVLSG